MRSRDFESWLGLLRNVNDRSIPRFTARDTNQIVHAIRGVEATSGNLDFKSLHELVSLWDGWGDSPTANKTPREAINLYLGFRITTETSLEHSFLMVTLLKSVRGRNRHAEV